MLLRFDDGHTQRASSLIAQSRPTHIQILKDRRPGTLDQMLSASRRLGGNLDVVPSAWTIDDVPGPNVSDKSTLLTMAYMALDAYVLNENDTQWEMPGKGFNRTEDIGWEGDGI